MSFWQEYTNRWGFVAGHAILLLLFLIYYGRAWALLARERRALKELSGDLEEIAELVTVSPDVDERSYRLGRFREALRSAPKSSLAEHLRALLGGHLTAEEYDGRAIAAGVAGAISWTDDILRFAVNGLVIVGLMGTLFGFYRMWGDRALGPLGDTQQSYLTSMSTALTVSFVGLSLGLFTNLLFAALKSSRQKYVQSASTFLAALGGIAPGGSKTHALLENLLSPLRNLVTELRTQNNEVLKGLTEAVNTRTEQLNQMIADATGAWRGTIQELRGELLKSLGDLRDSSSHLSGSSERVAATMVEVSKGLERTKDIGQIVARLDRTSATIVEQVGQKLDEATARWAVALDGATEDFGRTTRQQAEVSHQALAELTAQVATSFNRAAERMIADLNVYRGELVRNAEDVSARWLTEMANSAEGARDAMSVIVDGWRTAVSATSADIGSSLAGARELMRDAGALARDSAQNVHALSADINALAPLVREMSEEAAAPILLREVAARLDSLGGSLRQLLNDLSRNLAINSLHAAIDANTNELHALASQLTRAKGSENGSESIVKAIAQIDGRLSFIQSSVNALPSQLRPQRSTPPPEPKKTRWQRLKGKMPWAD